MGDHDALFKRIFSVPAYAADLLRVVLSPEFVAAIDLTSLELVPFGTVNAALVHRHVDLLLRARRRDGRGFVYFVMEHRSSPDARMPLRFMDYTHRVWVNHLLEHPDEVQLPPLISIVVHHGALGWTAPRSLHEMVTDLVALPGAAGYVPELRIALLDLAFATDEELTRWATSPVTQVALWLLRDGRDIEALLGGLQAFAAALARVVMLHPDEATLFMSYILRVSGERSASDVRRVVTQYVPSAEAPMASAAEQLVQQGVQQGRAALHDALHTLLVQRFGTVDPVSEARLHDADLDELKRLTGRVLGASSLADVFAVS